MTKLNKVQIKRCTGHWTGYEIDISWHDFKQNLDSVNQIYSPNYGISYYFKNTTNTLWEWHEEGGLKCDFTTYRKTILKRGTGRLWVLLLPLLRVTAHQVYFTRKAVNSKAYFNTFCLSMTSFHSKALPNQGRPDHHRQFFRSIWLQF